jgi:hypothetical protein
MVELITQKGMLTYKYMYERTKNIKEKLTHANESLLKSKTTGSNKSSKQCPLLVSLWRNCFNKVLGDNSYTAPVVWNMGEGDGDFSVAKIVF